MENILNIESHGEVEFVDPVELVNHNRLDVVAKYIYVCHYLQNVSHVWAEKLYKEHLRVLNGFKERDGSGKSSFPQFKDQFEQLICDIRDNGFDVNKSIVPISRCGSIIDGAHRVACCLYFNIQVPIVRFDHAPAKLNANEFIRMGLQVECVEYLLAEYCRIKKRSRVAVLFPIAHQYQTETQIRLKQIGEIIYTKEVFLGENAKVNLIRLLYRGESWVEQSSPKDKDSGIFYHISRRFKGDIPVKFIIFETESQDFADSIKIKIRANHGMGNDSIHINDNHNQTCDITDTIFTKNGLHWLQYARYKKLKNFSRLFSIYRDKLNSVDKDSRAYCIDASGVLAVYGLREVGDLDYLQIGIDILQNHSDDISNHNVDAHFHELSLEELIYDPGNHVWYRGQKFISLDRLVDMKRNRGEPKDLNDILMVEELLNENIFQFKNILTRTKTKWRYLNFRLKNILRSRLPSPVKSGIKFLYLSPSNIKDLFLGANCNIKYLGYTVSYSSGNSLIQRLKLKEVYEPEVTNAICTALKNSVNPVFLDIGANIGLMALNVAYNIGSARIFVFEPGEHQFKYLSKNVMQNKLEDFVFPINEGLSDKNGFEAFFVHKNRHSSGDGFQDTYRAGVTKQTSVKVQKLDTWWEDKNNPDITAIKIDTEGSELMILKGSKKLLSKNRPIIILEVHPVNLRVYPYSEIEILEFFDSVSYQLFTLQGKKITPDNFGHLLEDQNDFVAKPR